MSEYLIMVQNQPQIIQEVSKISLLDETTPKNMLEAKYYKAKIICSNIWYNNTNKTNFEDIFHDTLYRCLVALGDKKLPTDYMKDYFFKAFRINMIRYYGYSYNKLKSGCEIENALIPSFVNIENHIDGFSMLDYVQEKHGEEIKQMLWDNLTGHTYKELDKKYNTNTYYYLSKLKDELRKYYIDNYEKKYKKIKNI